MVRKLYCSKLLLKNILNFQKKSIFKKYFKNLHFLAETTSLIRSCSVDTDLAAGHCNTMVCIIKILTAKSSLDQICD
uniref:Uncharacterized protein n=1 Tax=Arundo donax TaxID=35708 RepID=A0A0A9DIE4_ARUDO